jgi:hypothetical protein
LDGKRAEPGAGHLHADVIERVGGIEILDSDFLSLGLRRVVVKVGWSFRFFSTPGRPWITGIEILGAQLLAQCPKEGRIRGESIAPADKITSFDAEYVFLEGI